MPVVKKVNPLSDAIPDSSPEHVDLNPTIEVLVAKIEEAFSRLNSLREPLMALDNTVRLTQSISERLEEVEKALSGVELGKAPVFPDQVYDGLTPADVFQSAMAGIYTAAFTTFPTMLSAKPELQATHIRRVIDLAYRTMRVAVERMPKLVEGEPV